MEENKHDQHGFLINVYSLLAIILLEGFVTISVEILTIRQLTPFVGNTVITTSLIIGIFLLFLAIGYWRGGTYTHDYTQTMKTNFTKAGIVLGVGLSYLFSTLYFYTVSYIFSANLIWALTAYLLLVVAPVVYWLGQTVPITTNLFRREVTVGAISGKVLFLSTVGSFLGAVLTSILLLNYFGVAWSVIINFLLLAILVAMLTKATSRDAFRWLILIVSAAIIVYVNLHLERYFFLKTNNYGNYALDENYTLYGGRKGKAFIINDSLSSFLDKDGHASDYIELIKRILFKDLELRNKKILVIGAGGFSLTARGTYNNHVIYLDIDKDIAKLAEDNFVGKIKGDFIVDDARRYARVAPSESLDVVISDAYRNQNSIPGYLLTKEYFEHLHRILRPGGIAVFNWIITPTLEDTFSKRVDNTVSAVFPNCMKIPVTYIERMTNVVYFCRKTPYENEKTVYTDNLNPVMLDFFAAIRRTIRVYQQTHPQQPSQEDTHHEKS